ncbi:MAG: sensor histidine kinase, partial [Flavobacteriales bacterium]|nr:sensor histidine kinase [Flavobacteriales bacterium]
EKQYISIGEELEMLRLYMNLEKMRFEDGFDYEIIVDEAIDEDYDEIPSMLIQPYVENAIWHGLMNKGTKGKIRIGIALREKTLYCTIDDNGVGRAAAAKLKARRKIKSKSVGMRITKDRLNILNEDSNINVIIEDKKDEKGQATGTKVEIRVGYTN